MVQFIKWDVLYRHRYRRSVCNE